MSTNNQNADKCARNILNKISIDPDDLADSGEWSSDEDEEPI